MNNSKLLFVAFLMISVGLNSMEPESLSDTGSSRSAPPELRGLVRLRLTSHGARPAERVDDSDVPLSNSPFIPVSVSPSSRPRSELEAEQRGNLEYIESNLESIKRRFEVVNSRRNLNVRDFQECGLLLRSVSELVKKNQDFDLAYCQAHQRERIENLFKETIELYKTIHQKRCLISKALQIIDEELYLYCNEERELMFGVYVARVLPNIDDFLSQIFISMRKYEDVLFKPEAEQF